MYFLLGLSLIFALLLIFNLAASVFATLLWRICSNRAGKNWSARRRADFIYAVRVFPFLAAIVFVAFFLVPAYLLFEPYSSGETVSIGLAIVSGLAALGISTALYRVFRTLGATYSLTRNWLSNAERIEITGVSIPVFSIKHTFPVVAIVGIFRPKMFVADQISKALNEEELEAVISHENGHLNALDNFKRTIMRICLDLLVIPFDRSLERAWTANTEAGADEYAARSGGKKMALNLAAALIKIARLVPEGANPSMPAGVFLVETQNADVAFRVQKLLHITESQTAPAKQPGSKMLLWVSVALSLGVALFLAFDQEILFKIHLLTESIVGIIQ